LSLRQQESDGDRRWAFLTSEWPPSATNVGMNSRLDRRSCECQCARRERNLRDQREFAYNTMVSDRYQGDGVRAVTDHAVRP